MIELGVVLVGCGRIGAHTPEPVRAAAAPGWLPVNHAEAIRSTPGLALTGVCDADAGRARATGLQFGLPWFTDYREMIRSLRPGIVSIATRTEGRCDIVEFAAANGVRGLHVEKPLGRSPAECRRAIAVVEKAGIAMTYGATRRWMAAYRAARQLAQDLDLRQATIELGRAALLWTHPHSFDLMVWLAGSRAPRAVQAACAFDPVALQGRLLDADPLVEAALVQFEDGFQALISSAPGMNLHIAGERGAVHVAANGARVTLEKQVQRDQPYLGQPSAVPFSAERSGTQQAFLELAQALRDGTSSGISPREILLSNLLGFACAWSSLQGGRRVRLEEVPEDLTVTGRQGANYA